MDASLQRSSLNGFDLRRWSCPGTQARLGRAQAPVPSTVLTQPNRSIKPFPQNFPSDHAWKFATHNLFRLLPPAGRRLRVPVAMTPIVGAVEVRARKGNDPLRERRCQRRREVSAAGEVLIKGSSLFGVRNRFRDRASEPNADV